MQKTTQDELPDELTITLRKPVILGKGADAETYEELRLREPLAEEYLDFNRRAAKDGGEGLRHLIARISGVPLAVIGKIGVRDFSKASKYLLAFVEPEEEESVSEDNPSGN